MTVFQAWQIIAGMTGAFAALIGGLYAVVTIPILRLLKSEMAGVRAEIKAEIGTLRAETKAEINTLRAETKAEIGTLRAEIKAEFAQVRAEMKDMEHRLNQRIDSQLIHH